MKTGLDENEQKSVSTAPTITTDAADTTTATNGPDATTAKDSTAAPGTTNAAGATVPTIQKSRLANYLMAKLKRKE